MKLLPRLYDLTQKKAKADIMQVAFDTRSWTAITQMFPDRLAQGKATIAQLCHVLSEAVETGVSIPEGSGFLPWLQAQKHAS